MLKFDVLTIFPELFSPFTQYGLISRAISQGFVAIDADDLRNYALNTYGQIDDTPYGGGSGMLLRPEPAKAAIDAAKSKLPNAPVVLFTPRGQVFDQQLARTLVSKHSEFILLCTRYEGVDERVAANYVDLEINMGDFIMMGGEVPAMAFMESISRLAPGVLGNPESTVSESFENWLLEYPQYTKPSEFDGKHVPEILLSGHHAQIQTWRSEQSLHDTAVRRPDLIGAHLPIKSPLSVGLVHYPVFNKESKIVTSSLTNLDMSDIARSCCTFGIDRYYIVHPVKIMRRLAQKILEHWDVGYGATYNPNRREALSLTQLVVDFDDMLIDIEKRHGVLPKVITTSARTSEDMISFKDMRARLRVDSTPHLIVLGTGWGLADEIIERADYRLEPIDGHGEYNHLSVRSAAAIILDRLYRV